MRLCVAAFCVIASTACLGACGQAPSNTSAPGSAATSGSSTPASIATVTGSPSPTSAGGQQAKVIVQASGLSVRGKQVGYGLVLRNTSTNLDASQVKVTCNLLDGSGTILNTRIETLGLVPSGKQFYLGGDYFGADAAQVRKLETYVDVGESLPAQYWLPKATHVRLVDQEYFGVTVVGQVTNATTDGTMSMATEIGCVLFNRQDQVIGGGYGYLDSDLKPGRSMAFKIINGTPATRLKEIDHFAVSVDNNFVN